MTANKKDVIAEMDDTVAVMQKGEVVEFAPCKQLFDSPKHEYTRRLFHVRIDFNACSHVAG
ncbi:hypothetical protein [Paenibacillus sp. MDMC362]|uniref:hypothetical protein n=1 Tax=Paenibacillus sp. MDMC362 TaxID=2977365 RepID=UPI000DC2A263|nr:hypothetical protein [Paenibacillus sp. MDMC362]RAR41876.1 hypothetical protein DP091_21230 [Paenibacillus sp. MDMC362]